MFSWQYVLIDFTEKFLTYCIECPGITLRVHPTVGVKQWKNAITLSLGLRIFGDHQNHQNSPKLCQRGIRNC